MPNETGARAARINSIKVLGLLTLLISLFLFNGWFILFNFQRVGEQEDWVEHTNRVLLQINDVVKAMKEAESAARGFMITSREEFSREYRMAQLRTKTALTNLRELTKDNSDQQRECAVLETILADRFKRFEQIVAGEAKTTEAIVNQGRDLTMALESQADKMRGIERVLREDRTQVTERARVFFLWSLAATTLLNIAIVTYAVLQFRRNHAKALGEAAARAQQSWLKENVAEVSRIVSGDRSMDWVANEVLDFIAARFAAPSGRVFVMDQGKLLLVSQAESAERDRDWSKDANLVAQAFAKKSIWKVEEIPAHYWKIGSGLGQALPNSLTFVPFSFQGRPLGVVEIGTFKQLTPEQLEALEALREPLGIGLNALQSRKYLQTLLERTQVQAEELTAQQEELRASNEELEQQTKFLETQQQSLNIKNSELQAVQADLERKAADLERSSQYKSEFLAKMSHELRTPLNGIIILSTLLKENKEKNLSDQQRQFSGSILNAGNDLLLLINDILDLSKIEARKLVVRPEEFLLKSFTQQLGASFEPQVTAQGLRLLVEIAPELDREPLFTDRQRLEQVLRNFLSNALKFTEAGAITLRVIPAGPDRVRFSVIDTGIGIPREKQGVIFEAFEQADGSVSRKHGGTGLGLTISRELAQLLGGEIRLTSEEGRGSEFALILRRRLDAAVPISAARTAGGVATEGETSVPRVPELSETAKAETASLLKNIDPTKRTILIVEDHAEFRATIAEASQTYGFQTIEAGDGPTALALLEHHTPTAILLDVKLPGLSGMGLLELIKQMPHLRHVPVHMISAMDFRQNALRMGALGYLTKPVTLEKVRSALGRIESIISEKVKKVLLIEDDENQSHAVSELIAGNDVEVVAVHTGREALENVRARSFDCIILDLSLPDISGFDLLTQLNSLNISIPPIVVYTGRDLTAKEEEHLKRHSESIIIKGARSPERLLDEVNLFLHRVESLLPENKRTMLTHVRSQESTFEGKTALVVDDEARNVFAITAALESKGFNVRAAKNGLEALEELEQHEDIDVVLMDIMMPKMNGFEAMQKIRAHSSPRVKSVPIVALTAKAMKDDHEKCIQAGANDYLPKPVNLDNLMTVLKVWLSRGDVFR